MIFQSIVFESNTLVCTSTENNHIAFKLQLEHLRNVLKTATVEKADSMIMKLVRRNLYAHHDGEISGPRPMLAFSWESSDMAMEQQMPVGEPCHCNEVARLCGLCDVASFCPFYIDFLPVLSEMTVGSLLSQLLQLFFSPDPNLRGYSCCRTLWTNSGHFVIVSLYQFLAKEICIWRWISQMFCWA